MYATNTNFNAPVNITQFTISQYKIGVDGALAPIPGPLPVAGAQPASLAINPAGTFAYVANYNNGAVGSVSQFLIGTGGALQTIPNEPAAVPAESGPSYVIVDPTDPYVYVTNQSSASISEYRIGADGGLISIGTTPMGVPSGNGPSFIAIDATGSYAYVADSGSDDVSQYAIDKASGVLTLVTSVSTGAGSEPYGLTIDATGKYLYVADRAHTLNDPGTPAVSQFSINPANGSLTPLPAVTPLPAPAPTNAVAAGAQPTSIATTP